MQAFLVYYFWITPHLLLAGVIFAIVWRGLQRRFPLFLSYLVFNLTEFLLLFTIYSFSKFSPAYRATAVTCTGLGMPLRLGVIYELSKDLYANRPGLALRWRLLLRWVFAVLLLAGAAASATQFRVGVQKIENLFRGIEMLWSVLICGMVLALFAYTRREYWRSYPGGIALGFGIFAAVILGTSPFRKEFGSGGDLAISIIQMAAYHVCVLVWLVYLLLPERRNKSRGIGLQRTDLEAWNEELQKIVR